MIQRKHRRHWTEHHQYHIPLQNLGRLWRCCAWAILGVLRWAFADADESCQVGSNLENREVEMAIKLTPLYAGDKRVAPGVGSLSPARITGRIPWAPPGP